MESLYVLIPLSAGLVLAILALFGWAVQGGQFDELEDQGLRIFDADQVPPGPGTEESAPRPDQGRKFTGPAEEPQE